MDLNEEIKEARAALLKLKEEQTPDASWSGAEGPATAKAYLLGKVFINSEDYHTAENKLARKVKLTYFWEILTKDRETSLSPLLEAKVDTLEIGYKDYNSGLLKNGELVYSEGVTVIKHLKDIKMCYPLEFDFNTYLKLRQEPVGAIDRIYYYVAPTIFKKES